MPRVARIVIPGLPRHITRRGNNRQDVFFVEQDRIKHLELLRDHSEGQYRPFQWPCKHSGTTGHKHEADDEK